MKLQLGQPAPDFTLPSHLDKNVTLSDLRGKNVVLAFFPRAWTPVCSGQIPSYEAEKHKFAPLDTQTLGISIDHIPSLKAWADSLGGISYPLLSDFWPHGKIAEQYGVLRNEGYSERALFVIDKEGNICYIDVHNIDEQPSNEELRQVLRRIDPQAAERETIQAVPAKIDLPRGGVVVYCTPWCPDCKRAKIWMKSHNVPYTEVDIFSTPGAEDQVRRWNSGKLVTPTFDADGVILADFVEEAAVPVLEKYKK
jgi:peroxiredoxin/glutaredoxin